MNYHWDPDKYKQTVEKTSYLPLQEYMNYEFRIIKGIDNLRKKTFIDVGAGYGRIIPYLAKSVGQIIAVELDERMINNLNGVASKYSNVLVIEGKAQDLSVLLRDLKIKKPVVLSLQNTLGTPTGDYQEMLSEIIKVARDYRGEIIISLFIQEGLEDYGVPMYSELLDLVGEPDLDKTDYNKGDFVSKTGYKSHWWRLEERAEILEILEADEITEFKEDFFYIIHGKYK